jgi:hypothetical protein
LRLPAFARYPVDSSAVLKPSQNPRPNAETRVYPRHIGDPQLTDVPMAAHDPAFRRISAVVAIEEGALCSGSATVSDTNPPAPPW